MLPMLTFATERLSDVRAEAEPLLLRHWEEVALNRDTVALDPDWEAYQRVEDAGAFHVTTARQDGALVGYAAYVIAGNLHYRSLRVAECDIFWLAPERRHGMAGARLLKAAEEHLRALGVNKVILKTKLHGGLDLGPLFDQLGYGAIERTHAKMLG